MPKRSDVTPAKAAKPRAKRAKQPAVAKPGAAATGRRLRIRQVRSGIGHPATYRRSLEALGLKHHQDEIVITDSPSARGMLHKLHHLVRVIGEEA